VLIGKQYMKGLQKARIGKQENIRKQTWKAASAGGREPKGGVRNLVFDRLRKNKGAACELAGYSWKPKKGKKLGRGVSLTTTKGKTK